MYKNVDLENILYNFNIKNFQYQKIKEKTTKKNRIIYKICTYDNYFCLKQTYFSINELLFIYSYLEWLNLYNIEIPYLIKTNTFAPYTKYNNKLFILTNWINGENLNYDKLDDCIHASLFLSKIHSISQNILFIKNSKKKTNYINLNKSYNKYKLELIKIYNLATYYKDIFSKTFLENYVSIIDLTNLSIKFSSLINFKNLNISLCHGDYVNKNIIISNKKIVPIDFDRACINFSISDLSYFLRRYLRRNNTLWNFTNAKKIIDNYNKYMFVSLDEYLYLLSYLAFPQKIYRISKAYYLNYKKLNEKEKYDYLNILVKNCSNLSKQKLFIYTFINYLNTKK